MNSVNMHEIPQWLMAIFMVSCVLIGWLGTAVVIGLINNGIVAGIGRVIVWMDDREKLAEKNSKRSVRRGASVHSQARASITDGGCDSRRCREGERGSWATSPAVRAYVLRGSAASSQLIRLSEVRA